MYYSTYLLTYQNNTQPLYLHYLIKTLYTQNYSTKTLQLDPALELDIIIVATSFDIIEMIERDSLKS